jgi:protein gp37
MADTKIEWADKVWNPITGCSKISEGCQNCYAERMANRLKGRYGYPEDNPFEVTVHEDRLEEPLKWKKPSRVFVCSMGDLFHEDIDPSVIQDALWCMEKVPQHTFLILTKRPDTMRKYLRVFYHQKKIPGNIWFGVTVENQQRADERIPILLQIPAAVRFVSVEPMLGFVDLERYLGRKAVSEGIDWVICGGETGPGARPAQQKAIVDLYKQAKAANIPFFFKKWGSSTSLSTVASFPMVEKCREFPREGRAYGN